MGLCLSGMTAPKKPILEFSNGNEEEYRQRFVEDRVLGEGEFGVVKMVHRSNDVEHSTHGSNGHGSNSDEPLAVKILRKGVVFKDNTLYTPMKPEVLRRECSVLKLLAGKNFNLRLHSIYESPVFIYIVTELCVGGEMMEWVVGMGETLHTHDVSRVAGELLRAVDHCHKHGVIHRDIKPENIMFKSKGLDSPLRLIDFGGAMMDNEVTFRGEEEKDQGNGAEEEGTAPTTAGDEEEKEEIHTEFAGTPFYISPEMFQHRYTARTDMWSVGVTLYVLVAGYPSAQLQQAFNLLHVSSKDRNLRELPNLPDNLPPSYFEMLDMLLTYRHRDRKNADVVMENSEFVKFYQPAEEAEDDEDEEEGVLTLEDIQKEAQTFDHTLGGSTGANNSSSFDRRRTHRTALEGSTRHHYLYLGFQKFERSLTTLLAATLTAESYGDLVKRLNTRFKAGSTSYNDRKLKVIKVSELKEMLIAKGEKRVANMINMIPNSEHYYSYAYHTALLRLFTQDDVQQEASKHRMDRSMRSNMDNSMRSSRVSVHHRGTMAPVTSQPEMAGDKFGRRLSRGNSVHGSNVYEGWRRKNPNSLSNGKGGSSKFGNLSASFHHRKS